MQEIASCILRWLKVTQEASPHFSSMKHRLINTRTVCLRRTESIGKTHDVRQEALRISLLNKGVLASREPNFSGTCMRSARGNSVHRSTLSPSKGVLASREPNLIGTCMRSARGNRVVLRHRSTVSSIKGLLAPREPNRDLRTT